MDTDFPERLTRAREAAGYSQNEVDRITRDWDGESVSKSSISKYETGQAVPSVTKFLALCRLYKANPTWVMTGKGIMEWLPGESAEQDQKHLARWLRTIAAYLERATAEGRDVVGVLSEEESPVLDDPRKGRNDGKRGVGTPRTAEG